MKYQLVVPMSGVGQRFVDAGYAEIKPLIRVDGKTIIDHVLKMYKNANRVICIISQDHAQKHLLRDEIIRLRSDAQIIEIPSHKLGPGHAILQAEEFIDKSLPTLVSYCDWAGVWNELDFINTLTTCDGTILTYTGFHPHMLRETRYAYVKKEGEFVIDIQEKSPYTKDPQNEEASSGCYGFKSGELLIESLKKQVKDGLNLNGEFYLSLTYLPLIKRNLRIKTFLMEKFYQWGTPEDLKEWQYWKRTLKSLKDVNNEHINGSIIVLAAGRGERINSITNLPKPSIEILQKRLWEYSCPSNIQAEEKLVITRPELIKEDASKAHFVYLTKVTKGQAITALNAIQLSSDLIKGPVHILSCDNVFPSQYFLTASQKIKESDLVVWASHNYPIAKYQAQSYSWIKASNDVLEIAVKKKPKDFISWNMIIGNFTFKTKAIAAELIQKLLIEKTKIGTEYYLDSTIELAQKNGLKVSTLLLDEFMAIGTPDEFLTYKYYEEIK